jgi:23S rRNA G2069 N7-methylase RlmK/C1962 C5-methylase RlmI
MPTPLFRLDLTRHLDRALQLTANRPNRVQLVTWAIRYLAHHTDGLEVVVIDRHHPARVVQVVGAAWLDSIRTALASHEAPSDVVSVVERVAYAAEAEVFGVKVDDAISDAEMDW